MRLALAGVLQQAGMLSVAADIAGEGLDRASNPAGEALALDTLIGIHMACGAVDEADRLLVRLEAIAPTALKPAVWFRQGTLRRMAGDFSGADAAYAAAAEAMAGHPGPVAAALLDRAEVALFVGDAQAARSLCEQAGVLWTRAGRRDGLYRTEAGLVRAALVAGQSVLTSSLDGPIAFARDRQMPLLAAHLLLARGAATRSDADLSEAVSLAQTAGAVFLEGRARLIRSRRGGDYADAVRTRSLLAGDSAWLAVLDGAACPW